jgi:uncharacterized protein
MTKDRKTPRFCWNAEEIGGRVFISNEFGCWLTLAPAEYSALKGGTIKPGTALFLRLAAAGFMREAMDIERLCAKAGAMRKNSFNGPSLHILVVTLECNHACVYCRATPAAGPVKARMSLATARRSVDVAFASPNHSLTLEFQGGEALLNWPVVRDAVLYAKKKNRKAGKELAFAIVTNLSLMEEEKYRFLLREGVSVCASLDGPRHLHDLNRRWPGGSSAEKAVYWLRRFSAGAARCGGKPDSLPSALMTTTRASLACPEKIVDAYRELGLGGIFLRPLSPIGYAKSVWPEIGYDAHEYTAFYRRALAYIIKLNLKGEKFVERNAALLARKLLKGEDPDFLDLKSPCGAASGQLAYDWNGDVYTCDEGRMAGASGDPLFRLGSVRDSGYRDLALAPAARLCVMASCLESQHYCSRCAFKPFCGVCPVHNYEVQGSPWGNIAAGSWCAVQKGVFRAVIETLLDPQGRKVITAWLEKGGTG